MSENADAAARLAAEIAEQVQSLREYLARDGMEHLKPKGVWRKAPPLTRADLDADARKVLADLPPSTDGDDPEYTGILSSVAGRGKPWRDPEPYRIGDSHDFQPRTVAATGGYPEQPERVTLTGELCPICDLGMVTAAELAALRELAQLVRRFRNIDQWSWATWGHFVEKADALLARRPGEVQP
jgi:hypothetical protein